MENTANNPVFEKIKKDISSNKVFLYMKGTPDFPQCGFSAQVVQILTSLKVPFGSRNILAEPDVRQAIKDFSDWPTLPQLYVKGEFVGGCDIITEMYQSGELQKILN